MTDISQYKVGVITSLEPCGSCKKSSKTLQACKVDVGDEKEITVVTAAPNVRLQSRVVVAPIGSTISKDGEDIQVTKATVGGIISEGMLCDSIMLGWTGGAKGIAVQVPEHFELGAAPPSSKPRMDGGGSKPKEDIGPAAPGLFEKKLTKEEKKKLAEEKRKAKRAAKAAAKEEKDK
eukprot:CAMPEP_0196809882 /NCGR_PEP_ID=MMETSP1362-20130617/9753_1 /TAXON_ID=163516 /ORGANISM="Leptocylindrus danicus, Strain CCMP1856" /LENGTH=176 /DNA_ID=CAMNT_0042184701 /DNA_START=62 /DNA_END=592 /DNA_ORIENTATION=+